MSASLSRMTDVKRSSTTKSGNDNIMATSLMIAHEEPACNMARSVFDKQRAAFTSQWLSALAANLEPRRWRRGRVRLWPARGARDQELAPEKGMSSKSSETLCKIHFVTNLVVCYHQQRCRVTIKVEMEDMNSRMELSQPRMSEVERARAPTGF